jgi:gas vesicle protein
MTPDQLYVHVFLWGLGMGGVLGALLVAILYADKNTKRREKR